MAPADMSWTDIGNRRALERNADGNAMRSAGAVELIDCRKVRRAARAFRGAPWTAHRRNLVRAAGAAAGSPGAVHLHEREALGPVHPSDA